MAAISHVFTIRRAAQILVRDEDLLWELSDQLEPEDGKLWVYAIDGAETPAFMASRLFAKLSRIRSIAPVNLKTSVPRCSAYAYGRPQARPRRGVGRMPPSEPRASGPGSVIILRTISRSALTSAIRRFVSSPLSACAGALSGFLSEEGRHLLLLYPRLFLCICHYRSHDSSRHEQGLE